MEPIHGHNWRIRVDVAADELDTMGCVMDFHELERLVDQVIQPMHNRHLNELPGFQDRNPSAELVAELVGLSLKLPVGIQLLCVEVWETDDNSARWRP